MLRSANNWCISAVTLVLYCFNPLIYQTTQLIKQIPDRHDQIQTDTHWCSRRTKRVFNIVYNIYTRNIAVQNTFLWVLFHVMLFKKDFIFKLDSCAIFKWRIFVYIFKNTFLCNLYVQNNIYSLRMRIGYFNVINSVVTKL